ncbi:MAG: toxin C-terminal domain-containing protein, partial [Lachnospiraceae bacterium]|nr:toxin C-terminal domain-containing protein [Lachnospiraceae bacterium]
METYQTGVIATIGAVATLACLEEADVSLFAINDEFHQTIIEAIPAPGPVIETLPGYGEAGIGIWVTPIPDQKTLRDYVLLKKKGKSSAKTESETKEDNKQKTGKETDEVAKKLGYRKINEKSHGQPIYKKGNRFITPDVDSHNGGYWKMADSIKNLARKATRMGTYDIDLNRIGD